MPDAATAARAQSIIDELSAELSAPKFVPHVTLAGSMLEEEDDLIDISREIAARIRPIAAEFESVGRLENYFRSLFIRLVKSRELQTANDIANRALGRDVDMRYMPHMSLLYSNITNKEKEGLIRKLPDISGNLVLERVELWRTTGRVAGWRRAAEFRLL